MNNFLPQAAISAAAADSASEQHAASAQVSAVLESSWYEETVQQ